MTEGRRDRAVLPRAPEQATLPWWRRDAVLAAAAFLLALGVFANSLHNGHVYDDVWLIANNSRLNQPWDLKAILTTDYWGADQTQSKLYRPLTVLSFAVDAALFGKDPPTGFHAMNILANAAVAVLVYALVRRLWKRRDLALVTAVLYATHPVHTEVVANGAGRPELYMTVALLAGLHLHLTYARRVLRWESKQAAPDACGQVRARKVGAAQAYACLGGAALLFLVALLFKESAVVLPGLAFVIDWLVLREGRLPRGKAWLAYLVYGLPLLAYAALRVASIGSSLPPIQEVIAGASGWQRFLYASETLLRYVGQLTVPLWLCGEYADCTRAIRPSLWEPLALAGVAAWLIMAVLTVWLARRRQFVILTGVAWFAVSILPVSNLLVPIGTIRADRLLYLPSLGFAVVAAWGLVRLAHARRAAGVGLMLVVLGFYAVRTIERNGDWRDQRTFWTKTVAQNSGCAVGWLTLGDDYRIHNECGPAAEAYAKACELRDRDGHFYMEAHLGRAQMLRALGDSPGAAQEYRAILRHNPRQKIALTNLGELTYRDPATRAESLDLFKRYTAEEPLDFPGHANLALASAAAGEYGQALAEIDLALELAPTKGGAKEGKLLLIKAEILRRTGDIEQAERLRQVSERLRGGGR